VHYAVPFWQPRALGASGPLVLVVRARKAIVPEHDGFILLGKGD